MVEAGADPDTKVAIRRDGTLVFRPVSLGYWAGIRILDPDSGGLISRSYSPMPKEVLEALCEPVQ